MITFGNIIPSQIHISKFDANSVAPTKHITDPMTLVDNVSRAGSIWERALADPMSMVQSFSDFYGKSPAHVLPLLQWAVGSVDRPASASDSMSIIDSFVWAGTAGGETELISAVFDSNTKKGMAVYVPSSGHVDLAKANAIGTTKAVGLATANVLAAATGNYQTEGTITQADWTDATGAALLTPGAYYYLSEASAGYLTTTAPTTVSHFVVAIARALSTTQLDIEISQPILL